MKVPDTFYCSQDWKDVRAQVLRRDRYCCVLCGRSVRARGWSRVDHIIPRKVRPDLALNLANLRTLCATCDNQRHAEKGRKDKPQDFGATASGQPRDPAHWWNTQANARRVDARKRAAGDGEE